MTNVAWEWFVVAALVAVFSGRHLWVTEQRDRALQQRLTDFRGTVDETVPRSWAQQLGDLLLPIVGGARQQYLQKELLTAGFRSQTALVNLLAIKAFVAIILAAVISLSPFLANVMILHMMLIGMTGIAGWQLPNIGLRRLAKRRQWRLQQGMPDALDLLVICAEAGLSLNQAIEEVSIQLNGSHKEVAEEFTITSAEMRVLSDTGQALDNLVDRSNLSNLSSLISALKQSIRFGTPLGEALRTIAGEMRAERQARIEERAARLPVLLAVPMMAFILPTLLMIVGTPVVLRIIDAFRNLRIGGIGGLH